jgi:ferrous iron transport protein B
VSAAQPLPASEPLLVAFVGRPNSGKSSLFNAVSGSSAHVGNFPGITVDILEARVGDLVLADLPGLYSFAANVDGASDEGIAKSFIEKSRGKRLVIAQVIDGNQLALGLRLTRELVELGLPMVLLVTQRDLLESHGRVLDVAELARETGVPAILVSARDEDAKKNVLDAIGTAVVPSATSWEPDAIARRVITDKATPEARRRRSATARVDAVLLHPIAGPFVFLALMAGLFAAVFLIADPATAVVDRLVALLRAKTDAWLGGGLLASFVGDGLLGGAGTVLAFMPQIVLLTVAMELLEATGYLARGAFLVDRILRAIGLSGHSFVPLLMGHACAVPAISATRIIKDPRERLTTILVLPLMTCSARIPTYALLIGTFFAGALLKAGIFVSLYFAGILAGLLGSALLRKKLTKGRSLPLVLEMPSYRMPQARVVARKAGRAAWRFTRDVGTTILVASAALWLLLTIPRPGAPESTATTAETARLERSIGAGIGRALEPVTRPAGFDWRINVGLIGSFGARELMVGTMGVIFGIEDADDDPTPLSQQLREAKKPDGSAAYSTRSALALMAFFIIACQCMSTVAAIKRETKSWRWPAFVLAYTYGAAYVLAVLVYQVTGLF